MKESLESGLLGDTGRGCDVCDVGRVSSLAEGDAGDIET